MSGLPTTKRHHGAPRALGLSVLRLACAAAVLLSAACQSDDAAAPPPTATAPPFPTTPLAATRTATQSMVPTAVPTQAAASSPTATPVSAMLRGSVTDTTGAPLVGVMISAHDDARFASVSVFSGADGRFEFPPLDSGSYRLRAHRIGWADAGRAEVRIPAAAEISFTLQPTTDLNAQLPPTYFASLLEWPSERVKGDFSRACANCHQIGDPRWREPRTRAEWKAIVDRMIGYGGIPFFEETREVLLDTVAAAFAPDAPTPRFDVPSPPSGDALRAVIHEWEIDPVGKPGCHDLEIGLDGTVYTVGGMYSFNPRTGERKKFPLAGGGHSVERDAKGDMWITAPGPEELVRFDVASADLTRFAQPRIGDDLGSYPHTLRFDAAGDIWYTLTRSNHVCRFSPATEEFTYYRLPPADPAVSGVPIPVAYGCDVAPDQSVWWSQLFGQRIGRVDPVTGAVDSWRPPIDGPRRLRVGPDGMVWVPGYGSGKLARFDPRDESWKVYTLPVEPIGYDLSYATAVNRDNGEVWIAGSNSDTMIRLDPQTEQFTVIPLPSPADFTREIEFDENGDVWTCTSDQELAPAVPGTGRIIRIHVRPRQGACGDGTLQLGEGCEDGNTTDCDGCSSACQVESGCGDGVRCGAEECDDGNSTSCDGCDACVFEVGAVCGDAVVNDTCGEECDPPGELCSDRCERVPVCGDGSVDGAEQCDDANRVDCDGCSSDCRSESGCGDGVRCADEECDDGNPLECDGCFECVSEVGARCGDGVVNGQCGEECDPPGEACSVICTAGDGVLGNRHLSFGGSFYSSSLGLQVPLGDLVGEMDLVGGVIGADGIAALQVAGPVVYSAGILGGQFGTFCVRIESCVGFVDCDGGSAVDVFQAQDSNGPGKNALIGTIATAQGEDAPPGAVELDCQQTFVQLEPGEGSDCLAVEYPASERVVYTTGTAEALYVNGNPKVGTAAIELSGEPFDCSAWQTSDGAGQLVGTFLVEEDPRAGDLANATRIDD